MLNQPAVELEIKSTLIMGTVADAVITLGKANLTHTYGYCGSWEHIGSYKQKTKEQCPILFIKIKLKVKLYTVKDGGRPVPDPFKTFQKSKVHRYGFTYKLTNGIGLA